MIEILKSMMSETIFFIQFIYLYPKVHINFIVYFKNILQNRSFSCDEICSSVFLRCLLEIKTKQSRQRTFFVLVELQVVDYSENRQRFNNLIIIHYYSLIRILNMDMANKAVLISTSLQ